MNDVMEKAKIAAETLLWATGCGGVCSDGKTTVLPMKCGEGGRVLRDAIAATEERQAKCIHAEHVVRGSNVPGVYGSYTELVGYADMFCRNCGKQLREEKP